MQLLAGDHLVSSRLGYNHHGLYLGSGRVVHYSGKSGSGLIGKIEETSLELFDGNHGYVVKDRNNRIFSRERTVERARSRLGEGDYCTLSNNCEHFVNWCITGEHDSEQVNRGASGAVSVVSAVGSAGALGAVSAAGTVVGLSGPGVMSGLASMAVVGSGAMAGLATLAAAPGTVAALVVNKTLLKDNPVLDKDERDARSAGRVGAYTGALAATGGGVAAVSAMGTVGVSAAGITSGLAAIGGGTMVTGVAVVVAAPAAAAAVVGYAVYRFARWLR